MSLPMFTFKELKQYKVYYIRIQVEDYGYFLKFSDLGLLYEVICLTDIGT